jgi:flagellar protein FlaF
MKAGREAEDREEMCQAARLNWRLWTILQADLLDPNSPVPEEIRLNMLRLAQYVDSRTVDFLGDPVANKLDILIAINREIAGGMFTTPPQASEAIATLAAGIAPPPVGAAEATAIGQAATPVRIST